MTRELVDLFRDKAKRETLSTASSAAAARVWDQAADIVEASQTAAVPNSGRARGSLPAPTAVRPEGLPRASLPQSGGPRHKREPLDETMARCLDALRGRGDWTSAPQLEEILTQQGRPPPAGAVLRILQSAVREGDLMRCGDLYKPASLR